MANVVLEDWNGEDVVYDNIDNVILESEEGENVVFSLGGGGGDLLNEDGVIKQEHLPNGYPYAEYNSVDILEGLEITFIEADQQFNINAPAPAPVIGKTYTVIWHGAGYQCVATEIVGSDDFNIVAVGDLGVASGEPTGEYPFYIAYFPSTYVESQGIAGVIKPLDSTTTFNAQILDTTEVVSQINPKYLPDGYPYIEGGIVDYLDGIELTYVDGNGFFIIPNPAPIPTIGETYTVVWNGVEYSCVATAYEMEGLGTMSALGDIGAFEGTPTGEYPFLIGYFPSSYSAQTGYAGMAQPLDDSTTLTLQILGNKKIVTKLDIQYLPDGYPYTYKVETNLLEDVEIEVMQEGEAYTISNPAPVPTAGETYRVIWNGVEYTCVATEFEDNEINAITLGDLGAALGEPTGEYPFCIVYYLGSIVELAGYAGMIFSLDGTTTLDVQIFGGIEAVSKIDMKYLPDGYPYVETNLRLVDTQIVELTNGMGAIAFTTEPQAGWVGVMDLTISSGTMTLTSSPATETEIDGTKIVSMEFDAGSGVTISLMYSTLYMELVGSMGAIGVSGSTISQGIVSVIVPEAIKPIDNKYIKVLPTVTAEDNGKFLMVENGVWAAVNLSDVSQEGA